MTKILVLSGGVGSRLWPLSRQGCPKQFLKIHEEESLLQKTVRRHLSFVKPEDIFFLTNESYRELVLEQVSQFGIGERQLILEPQVRNTLPALALGINYLLQVVGADRKEAVILLPSDHILSPVDLYTEGLRAAVAATSGGKLVTFGIDATHPETGYGYIHAAKERASDGTYRVEEFIEKPDQTKAEAFVASGDYYWNSGMLAFSIEAMMEEFSRFLPAARELLDRPYEEMFQRFGELDATSIDYGILEKSDQVNVLPLKVKWSDIGSFDSLYDMIEKDAEGNAIAASTVAIDTKGCLILGNSQTIATVGVENLIIIEGKGAILIANRGESQRVREVVEALDLDSCAAISSR